MPERENILKKIIGFIEHLYDRAYYILGYIFLDVSTSFLKLIGYKNSLTLGRWFGTAVYYTSRMKLKVYHNLNFALKDEISWDEKQHIAKSVVVNFWKNWFEIFFAGGGGRDEVHKNIEIEGKENLDTALALGKGVIAVSAHIGSYPLIAPRLEREGYNVTMVIRDFKTKAGSQLYTKSRKMLGLNSVLYTKPEMHLFKRSLKVLKDNRIICIIADENKRHGGVFVDFFGHPASTAPGPAVLALRTGAVMLPVFIMRNNDDTQKIIVGKEIHYCLTGDSEQDIAEITAKYTIAIENFVRQNLRQWLWTNWRWRTQPWGKLSTAKIRKKFRFEPVKNLLRRMRK